MLESALQKLSSHYLSVIEFLKCYFLKTNEKNKNNYNSKKKVLNSFLFPTDKNIETSWFGLKLVELFWLHWQIFSLVLTSQLQTKKKKRQKN